MLWELYNGAQQLGDTEAQDRLSWVRGILADPVESTGRVVLDDLGAASAERCRCWVALGKLVGMAVNQGWWREAAAIGVGCMSVSANLGTLARILNKVVDSEDTVVGEVTNAGVEGVWSVPSWGVKVVAAFMETGAWDSLAQFIRDTSCELNLKCDLAAMAMKVR